ncbi:MAG: zinc-binding dehydrogenase [Chloroflexi bacterium]|nr:zinc-binding dehydrogenase [Chloroflexota bacterium]
MKGRTIRYGDEGGLQVVEIDVPDPGIGEVQVRGGVCGICAWDLYTFRHGAKARAAAPPGHEGLGYVTKVGPGVRGLEEGDRVVGGGFQTVRNLRAEGLYRVPDTNLPDAYWVVEPLSCVVTGVDHCHLRIGDRVAVVGCGFMGLLMVQCLARSFADHVLAVDVEPRRLALAKRFGAAMALNPSVPSDQARLAELQGQYDCVVDASGAQGGMDASVPLLRPAGHLNVFGWVHGPVTTDGTQFHSGGYTAVWSSPTARLRDPFPVAIQLIERNQVDTRAVVSDIVPLDGMAELLCRVVQGEHKGYIKGIVRLE